ncbi:MAG: hypothetical protein H6Q23_807 [Bacteroidetes bacterium]|jgi:ABC-type multidrug transport system fused ATPase/permease subunit|nr:hypothetical protein [Bacteroidota bacterium]
MKKAGIAILIIGLLLTIFTTFNYFTREKVVDLGEIEISANKKHRVAWSPLLGLGVMAVGGVVFLMASKK